MEVKMKKFFLTLVVFLFCIGSAQAYWLNFDQAGTQNYTAYEEWGMLPLPTQNPDSGTLFSRDIWTYQIADTGFFSESFSMEILRGRNDDLGINDAFTLMTADVYLEGTYFSDSNIQFSGGDVSIKKNGTEIGSLSFNSALISELSGSLIGSENLGMKIDVSFLFDDNLNPDFFGPDELELAGKGWLLSLVGGRIDQNGLWFLPGEEGSDDQFLIAWDNRGFDAEFKVVPEPSTIILLGAGLLGLLGLNRKKIFKK